MVGGRSSHDGQRSFVEARRVAALVACLYICVSLHTPSMQSGGSLKRSIAISSSSPKCPLLDGIIARIHHTLYPALSAAPISTMAPNPLRADHRGAMEECIVGGGCWARDAIEKTSMQP